MTEAFSHQIGPIRGLSLGVQDSPLEDAQWTRQGGAISLFRVQISSRFQPKSQASSDQAPGPISARAAPSVASMIQPQE
jgi:hypothetical protein